MYLQKSAAIYFTHPEKIVGIFSPMIPGHQFYLHI